MNFVRSIIVPHTIASDTAQKTNSKKNFAEAGAVLAAMAGRFSCEPGLKVGKKPLPPMKAKIPPAPKANPKPTAQYAIELTLRLVTTLATTVPTFFMRLKPDLEHREAGLHEHHEAGGHDHPDGVGGNARGLRCGGVVGQHGRGQQGRHQAHRCGHGEHSFAPADGWLQLVEYGQRPHLRWFTCRQLDSKVRLGAVGRHRNVWAGRILGPELVSPTPRRRDCGQPALVPLTRS